MYGFNFYKPPGTTIVHEYFYKKLSRRIEETNRYDLVKKMPDEEWDWEYFSSCSNLDLELVELLPNKNWDYDILYQNFNITKNKKIKLKNLIFINCILIKSKNHQYANQI